MLLVLGGVCVWKSGRWLVAGDPFEKASWTVILAGESRDVERSDAALRLYLDGRIDTLVYSSPRVYKDRYASEFMTEYLAKEGYPREKLFEFRHDAYSTLEEARALVRQFRWQNLDTVLIVTSNYHTARTRRIFRKLAQGYPHILVYPAEYHFYDPSAWWSTREGQKHWLLEWAKTFQTYFAMMGEPPETGKAETNGLIGGNYPSEPASAPPAPALADTASSPAHASGDTSGHADSLAASRDTSSAAPEAPEPDSSRTSSSALQSADSAAKDTPAKPSGAAKEPVKEAAARKEPDRPAKDAPAAKTSAKSASKSSAAARTGAKAAPARKPGEKEKAKKKAAR